ncbi:acyl-CoA carboxylase epsilon subunit [Amycolatopsis sp. NPDC004079]|uniref:acyl-CoA carboxylase epsilon subunit n=1 Tax=Amycolatopsis sp. NPDC004079 TaxID=3154549 RepID=UPI0033ABBD3A
MAVRAARRGTGDVVGSAGAVDPRLGAEVLASGGEPGGVELSAAPGQSGERGSVLAAPAGAARVHSLASPAESPEDPGGSAAGPAGSVEFARRDPVGMHRERRDEIAASVGAASAEPPAMRDLADGESDGAHDGQGAATAACPGATTVEFPAVQGDSAGLEAAGVRGEQRAAAVAPAVRVVRGNPDDVEVAALLVALAAIGQVAESGREEIAVPSPRQPSTRFVPATSWRAR